MITQELHGFIESQDDEGGGVRIRRDAVGRDDGDAHQGTQCGIARFWIDDVRDGLSVLDAAFSVIAGCRESGIVQLDRRFEFASGIAA